MTEEEAKACEIHNLAEQVKKVAITWDDSDRLEFLNQLGFCRSCGSWGGYYCCYDTPMDDWQ